MNTKEKSYFFQKMAFLRYDLPSNELTIPSKEWLIYF